MRSNNGIAVLIPSYDRPEILETTLPSWLKSDGVSKVFIVAQASSKSILEKYENIIEKHKKDDRIVCKLILKRLGSVKARNALLEMASKHDCKYIVMIEDDMLLPDKKSLMTMVRELELDNKIGLVGGKIIVNKQRVDPDFFLNLPLNLADLMSKLTGYVFLDVEHGPRFSEYLPQFFMTKKEILDKGVRYDEIFDTPTGFREESDFQLQIKHLGYKLLYDPKIYVIHLAAENGGNRPRIGMGERVYWKARNHATFILKWNKSILKKILYITLSVLILFLYRIWCLLWIFQGVKDAIRNPMRNQYCSGC
jgi:GT2 family glycosyltransferase